MLRIKIASIGFLKLKSRMTDRLRMYLEEWRFSLTGLEEEEFKVKSGL